MSEVFPLNIKLPAEFADWIRGETETKYLKIPNWIVQQQQHYNAMSYSPSLLSQTL